MNLTTIIKTALVPLGIIGGGIAIMGFLISSADSEQRVDVVPPPLQVGDY